MSYTYTPTVNTKWYYQFEDNANDSSGNSNDLTLSNGSYVSSVHSGVWKALSCNGSSTNCRTSNITLATWTSSYTMSCWVKLNAEISSGSWTLLNLNPDNTNQDTIYRIIYQYNWWTMRINFTHYYNWPEIDHNVLYNKTLWNSDWHHITGVYNGSNMKLYLNWVEVASWWGWGTYWFHTSSSYYKWFTIWAHFGAGTFHEISNAIFDEVIIEDVARTAQQVLDRYNQSQKKYLWEYLWAGSGVTKWLYHLNWNANDESWNGNHWTATNVTWVDGKFGQCGSFSPWSNSRVIMPATWITWTSTFTALARFNTSNTWAWKFILAEWEYWGRLIKVTSTNVLETAVNTTWFTANTTTNTVTDGAWHLASLTYDWSNQKTYLDWVLVKSTSQTGNVANYQPWTWSNIGTNNTTFWWREQFNWLIDEVIIENRVWTALEIQKHYTYTKGRFWIM